MAVGAAIGAVVGAGMSLAEMNAKKKREERAETSAEFGGARPKRRNIARLQNMIGQLFNNKQRALVAMAQAHQNFANMW
ncbi:hypothetical protein LCGC14_2819210 [marine sediment metagenome]|uniref:Uncharacterized protein n=1 Tax=marine sediment metagenome TaxID=412755 RepID=A0A0F8Z4F9_9ZZZZ